MEYQTVYITLAGVFGLYMAWGIGANDVANAMATSVGGGTEGYQLAFAALAVITVVICVVSFGLKYMSPATREPVAEKASSA